MTYVLVTPPAVEPVSVAEIKAHARVDFADDDALLAAFGVAARQHFERQTNRSLISQSGALIFGASPMGHCAWRTGLCPRSPELPMSTSPASARRGTQNAGSRT
ncbi:MAG: phage head-tail connector protein [Caulobacteraceae bacterium]